MLRFTHHHSRASKWPRACPATIDAHHIVPHDEWRDTYAVPAARSHGLRWTPFAGLPPSLFVSASVSPLMCPCNAPYGLLTDGLRGDLRLPVLSWEEASLMYELS